MGKQLQEIFNHASQNGYIKLNKNIKNKTQNRILKNYQDMNKSNKLKNNKYK